MVVADNHRVSRITRLQRAWLAEQDSSNTQAAYRRDLESFVSWCAEEGRRPLDATPADIHEYRDSCLASGASNATVARRLSGLASFFRYVSDTGGSLAPNPVDGVTRPASDDADTRADLDFDDITSILGAASVLGPKTDALVSLLAREGVKLGDALAIDVDEVHVGRVAVTVDIVRRGETATLTVRRETADALVGVVGDRTDGPLFLGESASRTEPSRLTRFGADFLIKRASAAADVTKPVSANALLRAHRAGVLAFEADAASG